jgi:hypothetical protein
VRAPTEHNTRALPFCAWFARLHERLDTAAVVARRSISHGAYRIFERKKTAPISTQRWTSIKGMLNGHGMLN